MWWIRFILYSRHSRLLRGGVDWNKLGVNVPCQEMLSPPSRRRGLKSCIQLLCHRLFVASFAEAWIEIYFETDKTKKPQSPPSRRRGLKYSYLYYMLDDSVSPPSRRRGLKYFFNSLLVILFCRLLRGGVDWNIYKDTISNTLFGRLLRGGVDWNICCPPVCQII